MKTQAVTLIKSGAPGPAPAPADTPVSVLARWTKLLAGASGAVLAFFFLVGFHYGRALLAPFEVTDTVDRSVAFMASMGAERAIEFCEQNWLTLALLAGGAFVALAFGRVAIILLSRYISGYISRYVPRWKIPATAALFAKTVFGLVLIFFTFGWLPLNVAQLQAAVNIERIDSLFADCIAGRGACSNFSTANETVRGIRLTGDTTRIFVVVGTRQVRIIPLQSVVSVTVGRMSETH